ncbi:isoprenylcysteine carboxylmethyltransferase family protein [Paracoccus sp. WLY502]|uniref:isoprenylcysteine carboxylmethyltransferase family protein n=1 Tax=Paracoccus yibinensis TaxID=3068891 RepID=UPI002796D3CC|nr:isoprenylcysteine carboxylmethyltransferase family protein [Paracoccus sp. WLY502]MDQ1901614.1 isoprenylcysteine carboxylmethyltransferase family protein [Paracoccus sp. WLY502]
MLIQQRKAGQDGPGSGGNASQPQALGWPNPVHLGWLAAFAVLQVLRLWVLLSLGSRWTTRIIVLDEPLVARGPYRWVSHPNYLVVIAEIAVAPMVLGLWPVAAVFTILNALVLRVRIREEARALGLRP